VRARLDQVGHSLIHRLVTAREQRDEAGSNTHVAQDENAFESARVVSERHRKNIHAIQGQLAIAAGFEVVKRAREWPRE
jgi:hypothetical protein